MESTAGTASCGEQTVSERGLEWAAFGSRSASEYTAPRALPSLIFALPDEQSADPSPATSPPPERLSLTPRARHGRKRPRRNLNASAPPARGSRRRGPAHRAVRWKRSGEPCQLLQRAADATHDLLRLRALVAELHGQGPLAGDLPERLELLDR